MYVASTEHMGTQSQAGFHCFSTSTQQAWVVSAVSVNYIDLLPSRLVELVPTPVRHTCIIVHTRVKSHKMSTNRLWLGL